MRKLPLMEFKKMKRLSHQLNFLLISLVVMMMGDFLLLRISGSWTTVYTAGITCIGLQGDDASDLLYMGGSGAQIFDWKMVTASPHQVFGQAPNSAVAMGIGYPNLYFATVNALYVRLPSSPATLMTLSAAINTPFGIDVDTVTNFLYFTTSGHTTNGVFSVNLGSSNNVSQVDDGSISFASLQDIRVYGTDVYFASPGNNAVYKVPVTGGSPTIVCDTVTNPWYLFFYNNKLFIFAVGSPSTISSMLLSGTGTGINTTVFDSGVNGALRYMYINKITGYIYSYDVVSKNLKRTFLEAPTQPFNIVCGATLLVAVTGSTNCTITPAIAPTNTTYVNITFNLFGSGPAASVSPTSLVWLPSNTAGMSFIYHAGRLAGVDRLNFSTNSIEQYVPNSVSFTVTPPTLQPFNLVCTNTTVSVAIGSVNCTITPSITPTIVTFINISVISGSGAPASVTPASLVWSIGDSVSRPFGYLASSNAGVDHVNFTTNSDELYAPNPVTITLLAQPFNIVCIGTTCTITPSIAPTLTTYINITFTSSGTGPSASVTPISLIWIAGDASAHSFLYQTGGSPGLDQLSFTTNSLQLLPPNPVSFTTASPAPLAFTCSPTLTTLFDGQASTCILTPPTATNSLLISLNLSGPGLLSSKQLDFDGSTGASLYFIYTSFLGTGGQSVTISPTIIGGTDATIFTDPPPQTFILNKTPCAAGTYVDGKGSCVLCDVGTYSTTTGVSACTNCTAGRFNPSMGMTICQDCTAGNYSSTSGALICAQCGMGQFSTAGRTSCDECAPGRYQSDVGQSACLLCPIGRYGTVGSGTSNQTSCTDCGVGEFCVNGQTIPCPSGTFNPDAGGSNVVSCQPCPIGTYNQLSGAQSCSPCGPGTFASVTGSLFCTACPAGTWSPSVGAFNSSTCLSCPSELPASLPGSPTMDYCTIGPSCVDGYYTASYSEPCAAICLSGYKCLSGLLIPCPVGTYSSGTGNTACTECGAGFFSLGTTKLSRSNATCLPCPISTWSSSVTSPYCAPCDDGLTTLQPGSTVKVECVNASIVDRAATSSIDSMASLRLSSSASEVQLLIPLAATEVIDITALIPDGHQLLIQYQQSIQRLYSSVFNASFAIDVSLVDVSSTALSALKNTARGMYPIIRQPSFSLREVDGFCCDASDSSIPIATANQNDNSVVSTSNDGTILSNTSRMGMIISLVLIALIPLGLYRYLPARFASMVDFFKIGHFVPLGGSPIKQPTQYGAWFSILFLCMAVMLAIFLGTATNQLTTSSLQPPSSTPEFGTAASAFQFTLRAFAGSTNLTQWCPTTTDSRITHPLASLPVGFQATDLNARSAILFTSKPIGQYCAISAECVSCTLRSAASLSFIFPYNVQLIEWDIGISGAQSSLPNRFYGIISQLPSDLLDAHSQLTFSAIEAFYIDQSSGSQTTSGFEIEFDGYSVIEPQLTSQFNSLSTIEISYNFDKSNLAFVTTHDRKLSISQMFTMILSAIVSLFSVFMIAFRLSEYYLLKKVLKFNSGKVIDVSNPDVKNTNPILVIEEDYHKVKLSAIAPISVQDIDESTLPSPSHTLTSPTSVHPSLRPGESDSNSNHPVGRSGILDAHDIASPSNCRMNGTVAVSILHTRPINPADSEHTGPSNVNHPRPSSSDSAPMINTFVNISDSIANDLEMTTPITPINSNEPTVTVHTRKECSKLIPKTLRIHETIPKFGLRNVSGNSIIH